MKNIFSLALTALLLTPFPVKAQNLLSQNSDITYFAQLIWNFKNLALPITDLTEVLGWTVGRCYQSKSPQQPMPVLLIAQFSDDNGPMFRDIRFWIVTDNTQGISADKFDSLTIQDESKAEMIFKSALPILKTQKVNGEWVSSLTDGRHDSIRIRKWNSYYMAVFKNNSNPDSDVKAEEVWASCYFFKKLR